jgi:hypothetical protein
MPRTPSKGLTFEKVRELARAGAEDALNACALRSAPSNGRFQNSPLGNNDALLFQSEPPLAKASESGVRK